jgi:hypothetical protein
VSGRKVSALVIPAGATFVYASRESALFAQPKLEIAYCLGDK